MAFHFQGGETQNKSIAIAASALRCVGCRHRGSLVMKTSYLYLSSSPVFLVARDFPAFQLPPTPLGSSWCIHTASPRAACAAFLLLTTLHVGGGDEHEGEDVVGTDNSEDAGDAFS
ncbi:hypothetical protein D9613_004702 [Agrocybe pediades]|uniref:Uncharacterized protein n=1 Tax=Agrocybe pediades TaxID=84607 RepID=A0A8H4QYY8_9AGAR|nr:hypothetical protein D9613_004702 [Agrocybe pediades]